MDQSKVILVSLPRSGHHLMASNITSMFFEDTDYCEGYNCRVGHSNFDPVTCPGRLPDGSCGLGRKITKSHDFSLGLQVLPNSLYIALYRNPVRSLLSWFALELQIDFVADRSVQLSKFLEKNIAYSAQFISKWAPNLNSNVLTLSYDQMALDLPGCLDKVGKFLGKKPNAKPSLFAPQPLKFSDEVQEFTLERCLNFVRQAPLSLSGPFTNALQLRH